MEETISLKEVLNIIKKRLILIISFMVCTAIIAAIVSFYVLTPIYETSTLFIVNQNEQEQSEEFGLDSGTIETNVELINTYSVIIKSKAILGDVVDKLDLQRSVSDLNEQIDISSEEDSQVVTVTVKDSNLETAVDIANITVTTFQNTISDIMNVDNVRVISEAEIEDSPSPVAPRSILNIAIAIVLGAMIGIGFSFLLEYLDTKIRTEEDVSHKLDIPVIGVITTVKKEDLRLHRAHTRNRDGGVKRRAEV